jgi:hypothetical protein
VYNSENAEFVEDTIYHLRIDAVTSTSRTFNVVSKESRYVYGVIYMVSFYLVAEHFFGAKETEEHFWEEFLYLLGYYFLPSKEAIARHGLEYARFFLPAFSRSLLNAKNKNVRWLCLRLACKGFSLPFRTYCNVMRNWNKIKAKF